MPTCISSGSASVRQLTACCFEELRQSVSQEDLQAAASGQTSFADLCNWPASFCSRLWGAAGAASEFDYKRSFECLYEKADIRVYDFYAGSGTGSSTLKQQINACVCSSWWLAPHVVLVTL